VVDPHELLSVAVEAAEAAGNLLLEGLDRVVGADAHTKTTATDMVTEMDHSSEALLARTIRAVRPDDAFMGEEGTSGTGTTGVRWVVDPLDGTTNYLYGFPSWGVSVAAELDGDVIVGVVHDPVHRDMFTAVRDAGASRNRQPLRVSGPPDLATALAATGFGYDTDVRRSQAEELVHILPNVRDIRRAGAASLDLCWLATGRVDLYYERGLQPWDWAAGSLIAQEAGALVTRLEDATLVASAPHLHEPLLRLITEAKAHAGR
jgi:myo-inositol-1(or 4)-monophosphatase